MSEDEIRRAMEDARRYEAWDRERKDALAVRNEGERLVYEAEQALSAHGKELDKDRKHRIKDDIAALRKAINRTKPEEITGAQAGEIQGLIDALRADAGELLPPENRENGAV